MMSIDDVTMIASKTVTNGQGRAATNPDANDIHNAKMRCRTRAMAELGLGWDLWINPQNYPHTEPESVVKQALKKPRTARQRSLNGPRKMNFSRTYWKQRVRRRPAPSTPR